VRIAIFEIREGLSPYPGDGTAEFEVDVPHISSTQIDYFG
jgi:hypothetical protein